jgi:hypothetical protein
MAVDAVLEQTVEPSGDHEWVRMRVRYAVDPGDECSAGIVDLKRAALDDRGRVQFEGDLVVRRPRDGAVDTRRLLVVAANRGRAAWSPFGDGFLDHLGWSVAWVGWQWDVLPGPDMVGLSAPEALGADGRPLAGQVRVEIVSDAPLADRALSDPTGAFARYAAADVDEPAAVLTERTWIGDDRRVIDRARWHFARDVGGRPEPDDEHVWLEGGFRPHVYYEVIYTTRVCPVAGVGLLAFRDAGSFLRYGTAGEGNPCAGRYDHAIAHGASQSGRFMRGWLFEGLNRDEAGRQVYDGVQVDVAGGRRGECNHRYPQPALMYPAGFSTRPPFTTDDDTGGPGLLDRQRRRGDVPKVVFTDAAWEYWLGDAALNHVDPTGSVDLADPPDVRHYFFAGIDHFGGMRDLKRGLPVANRPNTTDAGLLRRAAFVQLAAWVCDGVEPPPSQVPRLADGTAVRRRAVIEAMAALPGLTRPDPDALPAVWTTDLGPDAGRGVGRWPAVLGAAFPDLVSAVDGDGNEVAGIRLPEVAVPVGTHTGWNVRAHTDGLPDTLYPRCGTWLPFAATAAERERSGDPRPSIEERYRDRDDYEHRVREWAESLVTARFLLPGDVAAAVAAALATYDEAVRTGVRDEGVDADGRDGRRSRAAGDVHASRLEPTGAADRP